MRRAEFETTDRFKYPFGQMKCGNVLPGFRYAVFAFLFFSARNLAHRNFVAFEILALAAADITRFLTSVTSRLVLLPDAFAAARTPLN
jgi:hypothetical protein